ncbi:MAG: hypothetical protein HZB16_09415 [Armatimonadetes bacterium]|nr:hypothetical protein [Armatimonadota bacterium]
MPSLPAMGLLALTLCLPAIGATYHLAADGSDTADGTTPASAWRTLTRASSATLQPGDRLLLRRGDIFRGSLRARSGREGAPVTYGAYGQGAKPIIQGSVAKDSPADWRDEGNGVWSTGWRARAEDRLPTDLTGAVKPAWGVHAEGGAQVSQTTQGDRLSLLAKAAGTAAHHVQLNAVGLPIEAGHTYRLAMRLRCDQPITLDPANLMKAGAPWDSYSASPARVRRRVGAEWSTLVQYYQADATDANARLTVYLGSDLPAGATLEMDSCTFAPCSASELPRADTEVLRGDVGNIIFDGGARCGWKVWKREDLKADGQYWYDRAEQVVYLRSSANPAVTAKSIELALKVHAIDEGGCGWVTYENLHLRYAACHGIGGGSTQHIIARDLDISYIGGADQYSDGTHTVRFGNGIEFWGGAHDNLVERCRIWEIYDAALTNQSAGGDVVHRNITYRHNVIWNAEFSFEYWNRPKTSVTSGIRFTNNTCYAAGGGWAHTQRPDPGGRHLCFYGTDAPASDFLVSGNIFAQATNNALYAPQWTAEQLAQIRLENNLWWQPEGSLVWAVGKYYKQAEFGAYQAERGQDKGSIVAEPRFVDVKARDFRLQPGSPGAGWGAEG